MLVLCGCSETLLSLSLPNSHSYTVSEVSAAPDYVEVATLLDYESSFNKATYSTERRDDTHVMPAISGEVEETLTFNKLAKSFSYIILLFDANVHSITLENILSASTIHNPFAASTLSKWQPVLQVFRL